MKVMKVNFLKKPLTNEIGDEGGRPRNTSYEQEPRDEIINDKNIVKEEKSNKSFTSIDNSQMKSVLETQNLDILDSLGNSKTSESAINITSGKFKPKLSQRKIIARKKKEQKPQKSSVDIKRLIRVAASQ